MEHKLFKLSTIILFSIGLSGLNAQTMYVKESNGTQTAYALNDIQKMSFSSGNLTVTKTDKSSGVYALSNLKYLNFSDITISLDKPLSIQSQILSAYPNPVSNILTIVLPKVAYEGGEMRILSLSGKVLKTKKITNSATIKVDLSDLAQGVYFCNYNNGVEFKTVKIIKQ